MLLQVGGGGGANKALDNEKDVLNSDGPCLRWGEQGAERAKATGPRPAAPSLLQGRKFFEHSACCFAWCGSMLRGKMGRIRSGRYISTCDAVAVFLSKALNRANNSNYIPEPLAFVSCLVKACLNIRIQQRRFLQHKFNLPCLLNLARQPTHISTMYHQVPRSSPQHRPMPLSE